jgi:hypothetical protein
VFVTSRGINLFVNPAVADRVITCLLSSERHDQYCVQIYVSQRSCKGVVYQPKLTKAYNCSLKHSSVEAVVSYNETQDNYSSDVI